MHDGSRGRLPRLRAWVPVLATVLALVALPATPAVATYDPTPVPSWTPTSGRVWAVARAGDAIIIGGSFTALRSPDNRSTVTRRGLAAFDADSGALLPWNPGATGGDVRALEPSADGTAVYVGGYFTSIAGQSRYALAALSVTTGSALAGFRVTANSGVHTLARAGSTLYVGGSFTTFQSTGRQRLAAVSTATGALVAGFTASANDSVSSLALSPDGSRLVVGGQFRTLSGQGRDYLGMVSAVSGAATSWRPPAPCLDSTNQCFVFDVDVDSDRVYAGIGGPGGRVSGYSLATGSRLWTTHTDGDVQAVAAIGSTLYVGGHFDTTFGGAERAGIASVSTTTGGVISGFAPRILGGVGIFDLLAEPRRLWIGGGFTSLDASGEQRFCYFPALPEESDERPPTVPTGLRATHVSDRSVALTWTESTDDEVVAGYRVLRDGAPVALVGRTLYNDTPLAAQTAYVYTVQAVDAAGNWSMPSAPITVRTLAPSTAWVRDGSVWRYLSNGSDQGTAWVSPGFNDAGWALGQAQLGFGDDDEQTVISPLGLTHYFRQQFEVGELGGVQSVQLRLLRDDGAVVYVNGQEVARSNMPGGRVGHTTPASSSLSGSAEQQFVTFTLPTSVVRTGSNTIAVEVHNAATTSTDVSFDLELTPVRGGGDSTPPSIPANLRVSGTSAGSVGLTWDASADDVGVARYEVQRDGVTAATVTATSWTDTGRTAGATHTYRVRATDLSGNSSPYGPGLAVQVPGGSRTLVAAGSAWRYQDTGVQPGPAWVEPGYDDASWPSGPAQIGFGDGDEATVMSSGRRAYFLRHAFVFGPAGGETTLTVRLLRDDGAVVALNGVELVRSNMPATSDASSFASSIVDGSGERAWHSYDVPASALRDGPNVLTVSLHQANTSSSDISFDLALSVS